MALGGMIFRLKYIFYKYCKNPVDFARFLGVEVGSNCYMATRKWPSEAYLIKIGSNVQITSDVRFFTHGGAHVARGRYPKFDIFGKICVEDNVYIGSCSLIMPGVTIGKGALVAAGSVVTRSVPPFMVVGGNPAKIICSVDEYIEKNRKYDFGTFGAEKREILLGAPDDKFISK